MNRTMDPAEAGIPRTSVLFVCMGNICRSPLAEGVFRHMVRERGLEDRFDVDSAGTGAWHVGEPPDPRSVAVASRHGVELDGSARRFEAEDLTRFDYVIAMDRENLHDIQQHRRGGGGTARVHLLREFDPHGDGDDEVPDPYYGGSHGFETIYNMIQRSCETLLDHMLEEADTVSS